MNTSPKPFRVQAGCCYVYYAYDIGLAVDVERCRKMVASFAPDVPVKPNRRAPAYFDYDPRPVCITQLSAPLPVGAFQTQPGADVILNDFGGVSVGYRIPFQGTWDDLLALSRELRDDKRLLDDSRRRIREIMRLIDDTITKPCLSDVVEDYAVFQVESSEPVFHLSPPPPDVARSLARVLRAESGELSEEEIADALSCRISYGPEDVTFIDWNAAILFDRDAEDILEVLEYANIELLEMRHLDRQLDQSLDRSYELVSSDNWRRWFGIFSSASLRLVGQMQVDSAILFERVSNALKLLGDQYLARVYRLAAQRFHLGEWNTSILRKLDTIDDLYEKMSDRGARRRLELLEWIIIILIALEIAWPLVEKFNPR